MHKEVLRVAELLESKYREIWFKEPEDVKRLGTGQIQGAYRQTCGPILYAESETREMADYLWDLMTVIKEGRCEIDSAKNTITEILEHKLKKWSSWYKVEDIKILFKEVILAINKAESKEDLLSLLTPLQMYVGKFNFWLDAYIPWLSLSAVFENSLFDK